VRRGAARPSASGCSAPPGSNDVQPPARCRSRSTCLARGMRPVRDPDGAARRVGACLLPVTASLRGARESFLGQLALPGHDFLHTSFPPEWGAHRAKRLALVAGQRPGGGHQWRRGLAAGARPVRHRLAAILPGRATCWRLATGVIAPKCLRGIVIAERGRSHVAGHGRTAGGLRLAVGQWLHQRAWHLRHQPGLRPLHRWVICWVIRTATGSQARPKAAAFSSDSGWLPWMPERTPLIRNQ